MHVLFLHDAFPAQFGRLGLELAERYGWRCSYLVRNLSRCPEPSRRCSIGSRSTATPSARPPGPTPCRRGRRSTGGSSSSAAPCSTALRSLPDAPARPRGRQRRPGCADAVRARSPRLPDRHLLRILLRPLPPRPDLSPRPPARRARPVLPPRDQRPDACQPRLGAAGHSATHWQRDSFPERFRPKIEVHFDGVDDRLYAPGPRADEIAGRSVPDGDEGRHVRRARPRIGPRLRPVPRRRRADHAGAVRRPLRRRGRRAGLLRLGQLPCRQRPVQGLGDGPESASTRRGSSSSGTCRPRRSPASSAGATCTCT